MGNTLASSLSKTLIALALVTSFAASAQVLAAQEKIEPIRRMIEEVWNQKRLDLLPDIWQPKARINLPNGFIEGYDRLRDEFISPTMDAFPDIHHEIDEFIVDGDRIAMKYHGSGTHKKDFGGKQATGKRLDYNGIIIFHLEDNKINEVWDHSNWSDAFAAL